MLTEKDFLQRIFEGVPLPGAGSAAPAMVDGFDAFEDEPAEAIAEDGSFARRLLESSGFGPAETLPTTEVILGGDPAARSLPPRVYFWGKSGGRPYQTLLFELDRGGLALLEDTLFREERKQRQLEDAVHRLIQYVLVGFEKGGEGRTADVRKGPQSETLVIVSVRDDREGGDRHLVCFGTRCVATSAMEVFTLREEARDWDRPLAEEHLRQLFQRHFKKLGDGEKWQDAFVSGKERAQARKLMDECSRLLPDAKQIEDAVRTLLDEIAGSFGVKRKEVAGGKQRLPTYALPENHGIGVSPQAALKKGFKNPLKGFRVFDAEERLLGYIVYVVDKKADADKLREQIRANNHFHNVLVVYPDQAGATLELWQGTTPLQGRLVGGARQSRFDGEGGVVQLLSRFIVVSKSPIATPAHLATELAWRAQHLKELAKEELRVEVGQHEQPLRKLHEIFNKALATLDEDGFADAYAQTITYGLLAARWLSKGSEKRFTRTGVADLLPSTSPFLHDLFKKLVNAKFSNNLEWLLDDLASLLSRTMVREVFAGEKDPSIHFYEKFLDAYDKQIRADRGVYYTPDEVVSYIVRTAHRALQDPERFGLRLGLADTTSWGEFAKARGISVPRGVDPKEPFVQVLDPATGTGTFILHVTEVIHETMQEEYARLGYDEKKARTEWVKYVRAHLLPRVNAFELMMAPYIVSHLRLGLALQQTGFIFGPQDRLRVFLTNTLEMHTAPQLKLIGEHVAEEANEAERVKKDAPISVIVGNPPYEREPNDGEGTHKGGWIRDGRPEWRSGRAPLEDYTEPASKAGAGGHLKNIYNLYVYFWRWASWRVFDRFGAPGVVSFITASSYLRGPGFVGMREEMRRAADEIYVLDLEGDQRGTRVTDNVFCITIPVCVGALVATKPGRATPGAVYYRRVTGTRVEKLEICDSVERWREGTWMSPPTGWGDPLMAGAGTTYGAWPSLTDLFPWQHSGVQYKRTWPIGETAESLTMRWQALMQSDDRAGAFRETDAWVVNKSYAPLFPWDDRDPPLAELPKTAKCPPIWRFAFRSFDRSFIIADGRLGDRLRPPLWHVWSSRQVYLASLLSGVIGRGPGATVAAYVTDLHHFRGSYGGKDAVPLWRDPEATEPNIAAAFLAKLAAAFGTKPKPEDVFAYTYAVLANPGYVRRFEEELQVPGPRLPVTKDKALFDRGAAFGRELLRWHTYGERFRQKGDGFELAGSARVAVPIPGSSAGYPVRHKYDPASRTLSVGDGRVAEVSPEVMAFSVSGLQVVKSWLDYRMKAGAGKKSSPLDDIRPERWTDELTRELLELLWVLEWTIGQYPALDAWLDEVLASDLFTAEEIPPPTEAERKEPKIERNRQTRMT